MTNSEWIEKLRAAAAMCQSLDDDLDYKYWAAVAFGMLPKASVRITELERELEKTEERVQEHESHENQTHEVLGKILGTDDTLENVALRAVNRIAELEAQVAALKEIVIGVRVQEIYDEKFGHLTISLPDGAEEYMENLKTAENEARRQLSEEHPEAFQP